MLIFGRKLLIRLVPVLASYATSGLSLAERLV